MIDEATIEPGSPHAGSDWWLIKVRHGDITNDYGFRGPRAEAEHDMQLTIERAKRGLRRPLFGYPKTAAALSSPAKPAPAKPAAAAPKTIGAQAPKKDTKRMPAEKTTDQILSDLAAILTPEQAERLVAKVKAKRTGARAADPRVEDMDPVIARAMGLIPHTDLNNGGAVHYPSLDPVNAEVNRRYGLT